MTATNICPVCANSFKLHKHGTLPRHGFRALNVRHGTSGGFHIGGHGGDYPIGTAAGNDTALREAKMHCQIADNLASLPYITIEDAIADALYSCNERERERAARRGGTFTERKTVEEWAGTSYAYRVADTEIARRAQNMRQERKDMIKGRRDFAITLGELVIKHPAQ